jgi:hypothetical protein
MSVPVRLATTAAGLVLAFLVAFGVGRVTGGADADGGAGTRAVEVEAEVHDMEDMADAEDVGVRRDGAAPRGAGEGG